MKTQRNQNNCMEQEPINIATSSEWESYCCEDESSSDDECSISCCCC